MWQMRNEEMETRLQNYMQKCWSLKQIILQQQNMITHAQQERSHFIWQSHCMQVQTESAMSYAIDVSADFVAAVDEQDIQSAQKLVETCTLEADRHRSREQNLNDRLREIISTRDQLAIELS